MKNKLIGWMTSLTIGLVLPTTLALACVVGEDGMFPRTSARIPAPPFKTIAQDKFNEAITRAEKMYGPVFAAQGKTMHVTRLWSKEDTVTLPGPFGPEVLNGDEQNAMTILNGKTAEFYMFGGLARNPHMTPDGFAIVLCHEIGHHLGGFPKSFGWASNEGQSDYFGSLKCAREIFKNDDNQAIMSKVNVPAIVTEKCQKSFNTAAEVALCQRSAMAGYSVANTLGSLREPDPLPESKFETPDSTVVAKTNHKHPLAQCRLDTYFAGAICEVAKDVGLSETDETIGTCTIQNNSALGVRPLCWFSPKAGNAPNPQPSPNPDQPNPPGGGSWPAE
jgi:hypothetical protein